MTNHDDLLDRVCADVRRRDGEIESLVDDAVRDRAPLLDRSERDRLRRRALSRMTGLSELDDFIDDPAIDEVLVNDRTVWIDRGGRLTAVAELGTSAIDLIERILAPIGRRADRSSPIVDARLRSGARVCAVLPPVAVDGPALSIRRFAQTVRPLTDFADNDGALLCDEVIERRSNIVVTGATSSGKTSLLAALLARADETERVVIIEDTAELPCRAPHLIRLEARPATPDGLAAISLSYLVKTSLRLRPDRLVVGEVRGDEVLGLVQAMNTGHDGSFSTCHANGPLDALLRLESLVMQAAPHWPLAAIRQQLARSLDVVVHVSRHGAERRITAIDEVVVPASHGEPPTTRALLDVDAIGRSHRIADPTRGRR
jgi:pilus assembly protein CpaF